MKNNNGKAPVLLIFLIVVVLIALCATMFIVLNYFPSGVGNAVEEPEELKPLISNKVSNTTTKESNTTITNTVENTVEDPVVNPVDLQASSFTTRFLKMEQTGKNLIYSPLSIQYALHMLNAGAKENTKAQIENVIGDYKLSKYSNIDKVLSLANGIFIRDSFKNNVLNDYKNRLIDKYDAEIIYDNFADATNVNNWINDKTMSIIPKLIEDEQVQDPMMKMILVNALAIDMEWKKPFDSQNHTTSKEFKQDNGITIEAATLYNTVTDDAVSYYKGEDVTALAMDLKEYDNNEFQFIAIMPNDILSSYVRNFEYENLDNIIKNLKSSKEETDGVRFYIPRFEYEYDLALKSDLMQMGITDAFNGALADFSGITGEKDLYVSDALHRAKIEFTNKGIKAAAVTAFLMTANAMIGGPEPNPVVVEINKPFLYVIREKKTNEVWFVGTVYEPMKYSEYQVQLEKAEKEEMARWN